jgi:hypothetical protein
LEHDLQVTVSLAHGCVGSLVERAAHRTVPFSGPVAAGLSRALLESGDIPTQDASCPADGKLSAPGPIAAMICCAESTPKPGCCGSPNYGVLMCRPGFRDPALQFGDLPFDQI